MNKAMPYVITMITIVMGVLSLSISADTVMVSQGSITPAFSSWGKSSVTGDWKIVKEDTRYYIELSDDFVAKKGPDVKVFLSPQRMANLTGENATTDSVFVKLLSQFEGAYRIAIPENVDLENFNSLVFHCEEYSKLWGASELVL